MISNALLGVVALLHDEPSLKLGPTGRDEYGPILYPPVPDRPVAKVRDTSQASDLLNRSGSLAYWGWSGAS